MGGLMSRRKGLRVEYLLRDQLRDLGYQAIRVPLSGASEGYKHDVVAHKDGNAYTFEVKARKELFRKVYRIYMKERNFEDKALRFSLGSAGPFVALSYDFEAVKKSSVYFRNLTLETVDKEDMRGFTQILKIRAMQDGADFLVVKDNHQPLLFIRYWV